MKKALLLLSAALTALAMADPSPYAKNFNRGSLDMESMSALAFGPDGILFVGDAVGGRVYAIDLEDREKTKVTKELQIPDIESKIGSMLGVDAQDVLIHDMAVNPISRNVYLAVSRGRRNWTGGWQLPNNAANASILLRVTPAGQMSEVALDDVSASAAALPSPVDKQKKNRRNQSMRVETISDLAYADGKLYVAGLSNEEFSSSMRVLPFPFEDKASLTTLEVYHGAHGKYETHSPVRAFLPYDINGEPHILASYLCTPLALFPVDGLKDKEHVKGKTIAELGFGNYPLDMLAYQVKDESYILIVNSTRGLMRIAVSDLNKPMEGIVTKAGPRTGVPFENVRGFGVLSVEPFTSNAILALSRNPNGRLDLTTLDVRWL